MEWDAYSREIIRPKYRRGVLRRLEQLEAENERLRAEIEFLRSNPTMAKGLKGEALVVKLLNARRARRGAGHDLESLRRNLRLEVKYSSLLHGIGERPLKRWVWTKLFGERGGKEFDRLLLVGDADPRYTAHYADPTCPYVLFDLSYDDAIRLVGGRKPGRYGLLQLTTNPVTVRSSRAVALFNTYQTTVGQLQLRYADFGFDGAIAAGV